jgi:CheY-like chemotaxis protein
MYVIASKWGITVTIDCAEGVFDMETILIIDDDLLNLTVLSDLLKPSYNVKVAKNGETALIEASRDPKPDLILLDIVMPDISGYEVCKLFKVSNSLKDVPILFTSALTDTTDVVKGFQAGAVDYITKPFRPEEVFARVEVHLELRRTKQEVQGLLGKTLTGSIRLMMDLLIMTQPLLVQQSHRIRKYAKEILNRMGYSAQDAWCIEVAVMLSQIGCLALEKSLMDKIVAGKPLTKEENEEYWKFPELGAKLLENIPRMERTAAIVRYQAGGLEKGPDVDPVVELGSDLLNILRLFEQRLSYNEDAMTALQKVQQQMFRTAPQLFRVFREILMEQPENNAIEKRIYDLKAGMVVSESVYRRDGSVILTKGTELNENLLDMIERERQHGRLKSQTLLIYP